MENVWCFTWSSWLNLYWHLYFEGREKLNVFVCGVIMQFFCDFNILSNNEKEEIKKLKS